MHWDKETLTRAFAQLDEVDAAVRAYVKQLLDEYHGEERPQRYYDILTGYWQQWLSHAVAVALASPPESLSSHQSAALPLFNTDNDVIEHVTADPRFHSLLAWLQQDQCADIGFRERATHFTSSSRSGDGAARRLIKRLLAKLGNRDAVLMCWPSPKCWPLEWLRFVWQARRVARWDDLEFEVSFEVQVDQQWRLRKFRAVPAEPGNLRACIQRLVPLFMPVAYLEAFGELRRRALRVPIGRPKVFYTAGAVYSHLLFKLLAAEHHRSALLLGHQHGASYGMELRHAPEEYERRICDFFYTWGWESGGEETRPLSPPVFRKARRSRQWQLMLCLGDFPRSAYRIQFFPTGEGAQRTIGETLDFAQRLSPERAKGVLIRPFPADYGRGWVTQLCARLPAAEVDRFDRPAVERFAASELVFHNCVSTGMLESIWLEVPTLVLYDPDVYAFRPAAATHMEAFERFGLLQRSGSAAAAFHAQLQDDIDGWWNQSEFRRARAEFCRQYVRVSASWGHEWLQEFEWALRNRATITASSASRGFAPRASWSARAAE